MEEKKKPTKSVIFYYIGVFIAMILLNALFFPRFMNKEIVKVDYGTFLMKVDSGLVKTVNIHEDLILFTLQGKNNKEAVNSNETNDPILSRLQGKNKEEVVFQFGMQIKNHKILSLFV